jgi:hypothetical protein
MLNRTLKHRKKPKKSPDMGLAAHPYLCRHLLRDLQLFKIPVNAYTLLTAALGRVLLLAMNYNHPYFETVVCFLSSPASAALSRLLPLSRTSSSTRVKEDFVNLQGLGLRCGALACQKAQNDDKMRNSGTAREP